MTRVGRRINQEKLLAKIAKITGADIKELEQVKTLYSFDESVLEAQSVINFYRTRVQPMANKDQGSNETKLEYAKRVSDYNKAFDEWRFRTCKNCNLTFAYAYNYEGVKFCSLDCLDSELRKIGLRVTYGRDLKKRWGRYYPAIIPSNVLEIFEENIEL